MQAERDTVQEDAEEDALAGWVTAHEDGSTTLRLEEPVTLGEAVTVRELRIPKLRAKHLRALTTQDMDGLLAVLRVATGLERALIDNLVAADALRAVSLVGKLLGGGRPRGGQ